MFVLVDDWAAEAGFQNHNRREHEARADFDEGDFSVVAGVGGFGLVGRSRFRRGFVVGIRVGFRDGRLADLVASNPNLSVCEREAKDVVDERLGFPRAFGDAEDVHQEFTDYE